MFESSSEAGGILRSEAYLTTRHSPDKPVGREQKINRIAVAVRPLTDRRTPENLLIHGPAGVGKTTCVSHVLEQLESESRVKPVYVNCWQYNTRPSFLTQLLIALGYPAPRKGKPVDELLARLREWLDKNRSVAVALDEFDQLREQTKVIYDLQHLSEEAENEFGLLLVSNQHPTSIELDPRSESRLTCHTLEFRPYSQDQLEEILEQRAEQAFRKGSVSEGVLETIADSVASRSGDCRQAMEILLRAGRLADQQGASEVSEDHVQQVLDD